MARRTSNRRKFVWARYQAALVPTAGADAGVDLLGDFKDRVGGSGAALGSTVVTVRGVIRPNVSGGEFVGGTFGIRVCNEGDIGGTPDEDENPDGNPEADWMAWLPFIVPGSGDNAGNPPATWNEMASPWALEIKSQRKMEELGETLGLFWSTSDAVTTIDVSLSIGLKLP